MTARGLDHLLALASAHPLTPTCDTFYFLRHGQTPNNALKIFQTYAEPLSPTGQAQARAAADSLAALSPATRPQSILVSDATRTLQTAQPIAAALQLHPQPRRALRERHFGDLWGTSSADIDWACEPAGGETAGEFVDRTRGALEDALNGGEKRPVLIVAHGGNLLVLAAALGVPFDRPLLANALPLRFTRVGGVWGAEPLLPVPVDEGASELS